MDDPIRRADAIEAVADRIYDDLCYMYCNNCRYDSEIGEDDPRWSCYDCYRKYNSWGISSAVAKGIAEHALNALPSADAVSRESYIKAVNYVEWLEKLIVDAETFEWLCEDTNDKEWCEDNCHYSSIQAECLRHLYDAEQVAGKLNNPCDSLLTEDSEERKEHKSKLESAEAVQGEWTDIDDYYRMATCSRCHKVTMFEKWGEYTKPYDFCPNCGARMHKGGDDE